MDDDFNSAQAIGYVFDAVRQVNRLFDHNKILSSDQQNEICSIYQDIHKNG
jgi:Cysteinyl-tRNA synthetase